MTRKIDVAIVDNGRLLYSIQKGYAWFKSLKGVAIVHVVGSTEQESIGKFLGVHGIEDNW